MVGPRKGQLLGSLNLGVDSEFIAARDRSKDSRDILVDQKIRIATHNNVVCRILGGLEHFGNADVCLSGTVASLKGSRRLLPRHCLSPGVRTKIWVSVFWISVIVLRAVHLPLSDRSCIFRNARSSLACCLSSSDRRLACSTCFSRLWAPSICIQH